jgi:NhaA family Na+:H+ antiporter
VTSIAAIIVANSVLGDGYQKLWKTTIGITLGDFVLMKDMNHWINEGFMAIFFFVVGLEIKRELL